MANSNCLEGFKCPECGYEDEFLIVAMAEFRVTDDGTTEFTDVDWTGGNICKCAKCDHYGKVWNFDEKYKDLKPCEKS